MDEATTAYLQLASIDRLAPPRGFSHADSFPIAVLIVTVLTVAALTVTALPIAVLIVTVLTVAFLQVCGHAGTSKPCQ